jgi:HEAT repeat protein
MLVAMRSDAKAAVPSLQAALTAPRKPDMTPPQAREAQETREEVAKALAGLGEAGLPILVAAARPGDADVRVAAINALATIGRAAMAAIPAIEKAATDSNEAVQKSAAAALKAIKVP